MKKRLALAALAFSIIPFTSFAVHLEPDESEIKASGDLVYTNLEGYDLFSKNLSDDILIALTVNGYDIKPGSNLNGADLRSADLSDADLRTAKLNGADLRSADLSDAKLLGAKLNNADLMSAMLRNADLRAAELRNANLLSAKLKDADLRNAKLNDADLRNAELRNADLRNADLSGARLSNADLTGAILTGSYNLNDCPSRLPDGWVCQNNSLFEKEEEVVVEVEGEDIDFDSITVESLPYEVSCPSKNKNLKIKQNKKGKFIVRFAKGKKFYRGKDFDKAVDTFKKTYEDKCV